ncbi:MAG: PH domain-containing protein [Ginsengibacter sp.]
MISSKNKTIDYSLPQRQAVAGLIIEMLLAFKELLQKGWPLFLIIISQVKKNGLMTTSLAALSIIPMMVILGYLNYRKFLFYFDEEKEEFILQNGLFNKKKVIVQFDRIQQVNINQSFIKRLFDVYEVEIETAGSVTEEAKIRAVSKQTALYIRDRLLSGKRSKGENKSEIEDAVDSTAGKHIISTISISLGSLVKTAVTANYRRSLILLIFFFGGGYYKLKNSILKDNDIENKLFNYLANLPLAEYIFMTSFVFIVLLIVFNLLRFIIVYYGFTIKRHGQSLQFSYGLLNTKNTVIQPSKVQKVRIVTNYLQRKMELARMFISQASNDILSDKKASIQLPGFNKEEGKQLLQFLYNTQPVKGAIVKPTIRKVTASVNKFIVLPVMTALIICWIKELWTPFFIGLPIYLTVISFFIYISYLNYRLFVHEDFIIKKSGIWDIDTEIIEPFRIQAITTEQYLWHVRSNVGHVTLHTAGGNLTFKFGNFLTVKKYVNYWLYQVETSDKHWM